MNGIYEANLYSWWYDNDGDKHSTYHSANLRFYDEGIVISKGGAGKQIDINNPESFSLKERYEFIEEQLILNLEKASGTDEIIEWWDVEMKYAGDVISNNDFLKAGRHVAIIDDNSIKVCNLTFVKT